MVLLSYGATGNLLFDVGCGLGTGGTQGARVKTKGQLGCRMRRFQAAR
jgi:hypothetical protein